MRAQRPRAPKASPETRKAHVVEQRREILIVCEGEQTEPNYFRRFHATNDVHGNGYNTLRVIDEAKRIQRLRARETKEDPSVRPYDEIWCVFDRDSFPAHHFDNAISAAEAAGFHVAWSNESFELWFILHFEFLQSGLTRNYYRKRLSQLLGRHYEKNDERVYDALQSLGSEDKAMTNAAKLRDCHAPSTSCSRQCPMTTVDQLVRALRRWSRDERWNGAS